MTSIARDVSRPAQVRDPLTLSPSLLRTLGFAGTGLVLGSALATSPKASAAGEHAPNIIFILADDMGYGDPSSYGQTKIHTPNIDQLALEGIRFTDGYAGAPVCAPSRCSLMTGLDGGHERIRDNFAIAGGIVGHKGKEVIRRASLTAEDRTVADYLLDGGYSTGLMGKWHLDGYDPSAAPTHHGFQEFKGWLTQTESTQGYWPTQRYHNETLIDIPENAKGRHGRYDTTMITEDAVDYIEHHRNAPFFLYVAYDSPHSPYTAPDFGPYKDCQGWADDEKTYASMIDYMDRGVGRIMETVKRLGLDGDTIVFFASDNGPRSEPTVQQTRVVDFFDSNGNLTGYKRDLYEGGIRDPWIVRWPGHAPAGLVSDLPVYFADFLPTALDLAGLPATPTDGVSLKPYFLNQTQRPSDRLFYWEFYEPAFWQSARFGRWKAVRLKRGGPLEIYDLSVDRWESKNIAESRPEIVAMFDRLMTAEHRGSIEYPDPK